MEKMNHNENYWNIPPLDGVTLSLPRIFNKVIYEMTDAFMNNKTIFKPLHS
jgi:hypothetical protein